MRRMTKTIDKLVVNEENIRKNIYLSKGVVFSERILSKSIEKGLSREEAYDEIQRLASKVMEPESTIDLKKPSRNQMFLKKYSQMMK